MSDLRAELAGNLDEAELDWLKPHIQRDVVVVVNPELDLLDVGVRSQMMILFPYSIGLANNYYTSHFLNN